MQRYTLETEDPRWVVWHTSSLHFIQSTCNKNAAARN